MPSLWQSWIEETCHNVMKESQSTSNLHVIHFLTRKLHWKFNNFGISSWVGACKLTNARFVDSKERWHVWTAALTSSLKPFFFQARGNTLQLDSCIWWGCIIYVWKLDNISFIGTARRWWSGQTETMLKWFFFFFFFFCMKIENTKR